MVAVIDLECVRVYQKALAVTVPPIKEFEVMLREAADVRQAALEAHRQQRRKRIIGVMRYLIRSGIGLIAGMLLLWLFVSGVALMVGR